MFNGDVGSRNVTAKYRKSRLLRQELGPYGEDNATAYNSISSAQTLYLALTLTNSKKEKENKCFKGNVDF